MPRFIYGTTTIDYELAYIPDQSDITISVEWLDGVRVSAPKTIETDELHSILYKKAPWILEKWNNFNEIVNPPEPKEYVSGEKFPYLGRNYRLKVNRKSEVTKPSLQFRNGKFIAQVPTECKELEQQEQLKKHFENWYRNHGEKKIKERLRIYCPKMDVVPTKVVLKDQKMRWGSCSTNSTIYLNWRIIMAPIPVIDYLLVHELAHIKYPNHSKDFWKFVRSTLPDYKERKEWLRINGPLLTL